MTDHPPDSEPPSRRLSRAAPVELPFAATEPPTDRGRTEPAPPPTEPNASERPFTIAPTMPASGTGTRRFSSKPPPLESPDEVLAQKLMLPREELLAYAATEVVKAFQAITRYRQDFMDEEGWLARRFSSLFGTIAKQQVETTDALNRCATLLMQHTLRLGELEGTTPPNGLGGKRILVVDDDAALLRLLGKQLVSRGAQVVTAATIDEAWQAANGVQFDCILVDLHMPERAGAVPQAQHGTALVAWCKQKQPHAAIVVMTGLPFPEYALHVPTLQKPASLAELERALCEAMEHAAAQAAPPQLPELPEAST